MSDDIIGRIENEIAQEGEVQIAEPPVRLLLDGGGSASIIDLYTDMPSFGPTEFDRMIAQRAEAQHNAEGDANDDLQAHAQLAEAEQRVERADAPFACINPPSFNRGTPGQTVTLKPGTSVFDLAGLTFTIEDGEPQLVAFWSGLDREVCPVTVTCAPVLPIAGVANANNSFIRATAVVKWGAHGAKFQAVIDVGTGFEIVVNASNVFLEVFLEGAVWALASGLIVPATREYLVAGSVGTYPAMRTQPAVRSLRADLIAASLSATFDRPAFAATVVGVERIASPFDMTFLDANGVALSTRSFLATEFITTPIVMYGPVVSVMITDTGAGSQYTIIFGVL